MLGCIGVVYGDIGTSPLYAFREAAHIVGGKDGMQASEIYGILSLIIWALLAVVTLKYILFLLYADNKGEGGLLSLTAQARKATAKYDSIVLFLGILGAALFYGDAAITPAISVLSAVEGMKLVTPAFDHMVLPTAMTILIVLFWFQKKGTARMSIFFGPVTLIWFLCLGVAGIVHIVDHPRILMSFSPHYAILFLINHSTVSLAVIGAVFLAITGAEALYEDLGHFGRRPIQLAWLWLVFPCLVLNYMGQGALVLDNPKALENPFFLMFPDWALAPMVGLATLATIIASQAVITGTYSLTRSAIQLGILPRMEIRHTSREQHGQIYMPKVNRLLLLAVLFLCLMFGSSSALASAYGIAVSGTFIVTSALVFLVVWKVWDRSLRFTICLLAPFAVLELVFLAANLIKIFDGGYVPLFFAGFLVMMMMTWVAGTRYLYVQSRRISMPLEELKEKMVRLKPARVPGTAIFLTSDSQSAPIALLQNLKHNKVLHEHNIILTVVTAATPKVAENHRIVIESASDRIASVILHFGYMETPDVPRALASARFRGFDIDLENASYFLGRRSIVIDGKKGLPEWQDRIYIAMARSAINATDFFRIPPGKVVEMGVQMPV